MSRSVWVVETGAYSDKGIAAVFGSEAGARAYCDAANKGLAESSFDRSYYDEYEVRDDEPEAVRILVIVGAEVDRYSPHEREEWRVSPHPPVCVRDMTDSSYLPNRGPLYVDGADYALTRKVFGERRARVLAEMDGLV